MTKARWGVAVAAGAVVAGVLVARHRRTHPGSPDLLAPDVVALPPGRSMRVTAHDGVDLAVSVVGPDDGPTVVLSHCWMGSRRLWADVAGRLADDGHRVVLYDQRGHGESSCPDRPPTIVDLGHDLRAVLDAVGVERAVFAGHSMGGMTIQSYAAEHPEHFAARAEGVVLVATAARTLGRALPAAMVELMMGEGRSEWSRRGRVGYRMARRAHGAEARRDHVLLTLEGMAATPGIVRAGFLSAMSTMDLRHGNRTIAVPTTVVVGTRDRLTPPRMARQLAESIDGSRLVVLPQMGHMLPLEAPDLLVDAIRATVGQRDAELPVEA